MLARFRTQLTALFQRSRFERDMTDEFQFHLEERVDALVRSGLSIAHARRQARLEFGSMDTYKDQCRSVSGVRWVDDARIDLLYAWRGLRRAPGFAIVAIATLAVSIGFNATLFTIVSGMRSGTPPVARADRVVTLGSLDPSGRPLGVSFLDFEDWRQTSRSFEAMAAYGVAPMTLTDRDRAATRVSGAYMSATTFSLVGERPVLGRDFTATDDEFGAQPVAIIGASLWKSRYDRDPDIIGRVITINGAPTTIVGVMQDGFGFPLIQELWQPLAAMPGLRDQARDVRGLRAFGRLADGVQLEQVRAEFSGIGTTSAQAYPRTNANVTPNIQPFGARFAIADPWNAMLLAISLVLLIACANIANLLLARAASRSHELAIRRSLGATRSRLLRQLLVESVLLAALAGVASVGVAFVGVRLWLVSMPQANWPYWYHFAVDGRVLAYIGAVSLASVLLFGVGPSWSLSRSQALTRVRPRRWTNLLLGSQFALTLSLLAGAGLLARTLMAVYRADAIVDTSPVLLAGVDLPPHKYATPAQRDALYRQLEAGVSGLPNVDAVTIASGAPFYNAPVRVVTMQAETSARTAAGAKTSYVLIGPRYFDTLGLHLHRGRVFTDLDGTPGHETAIVNQLFASSYLPGLDPIGQRIRITDPNRPDPAAPWLTIVGVSPSVREHYAQEFDPVVYVPYRLSPPAGMVLLARSRSDAATLAPSLRDALRHLDPDLPLVDIRPLDWLLSGTRFANQVFATLFGLAALIGLVLAAIGLHALIAFEIRQRTQEIGVRMALGARSPQVIWLFVRYVLKPLGWGLVAGLIGALGVGRFVGSMLIATSPTDPLTLASIAGILIVVAFIAAFRPARRATQLDPVSALRHE